ncbi:hypothetical protein Tco_1314421 [Tanacetum coccineum]
MGVLMASHHVVKFFLDLSTSHSSLTNSWASFTRLVGQKKTESRSFLAVEGFPIWKVIGCEVSAPLVSITIDVKFLEEEENHRSKSRLGILFCKEILKGEMVRMHYALLHDEVKT